MKPTLLKARIRYKCVSCNNVLLYVCNFFIKPYFSHFQSEAEQHYYAVLRRKHLLAWAQYVRDLRKMYASLIYLVIIIKYNGAFTSDIIATLFIAIHVILWF